MPSGPGVISEDLIAKIAKAVPNNIETFLLTSKQTVKEIIEQLKNYKTTTVQIVDDLVEGSYEEIRSAIPHIKIVQVIHVEDEKSIEKAVLISKYVDALLLDSGNQKLQVKELGGTGRIHDWSLSKKIVEEVNVPVYLAGGLNSKNVGEAIKTVMPYGIDLCSGVRSNGRLNKLKLTEFFNSVNKI